MKNGVLRNFAKFTKKYLHQSLFFNKVPVTEPLWAIASASLPLAVLKSFIVVKNHVKINHFENIKS